MFYDLAKLSISGARIAVAYGNVTGFVSRPAANVTFSYNTVSRFFSGRARNASKTQTTKRAINSVEKVKKVRGAPRQLTVGAGKTAGRNSAGRITSFHRGGGAKRLQRIVDTKRNITSVGVIQRIDYDPNRSARLALVRWVDDTPSENEKTADTNERPNISCLTVEPETATTCGLFSLSALSDRADERTVSRFSSKPLISNLIVGQSPETTSNKINAVGGDALDKTAVRDIFLQSLSSKGKHLQSSFPLSGSQLPRIAVAGAKPAFSAAKRNGEYQIKNSNLEVSSWKLSSNYWAHRIRRKAAVSWKNLDIF